MKMAEDGIVRYNFNVQFVLKIFASFVLILQPILEYYDMKSFVYVFHENYYSRTASSASIVTPHEVDKIFAPVYLLKMQPAVVICYCVVAGLYGIFKKKRCFFIPFIVFQFLILVKVIIAYILWLRFGEFEENLGSGAPFRSLIHINLFTVLAKHLLQWTIASGYIIQFGVGVLFLSVIIFCYVVTEPEEINEKNKQAHENNIFDYQSLRCFCCSRSWLRVATFFILVYRLIVANLETFSDFLCYDGFKSLEPGWLISDTLTAYFIIEQVATLVAFYGLFVTESKVMKFYVKFQLLDLLKQTVTLTYPVLLDFPNRPLEPLSITKIFINKNINMLWSTYVYLFIASCSIVIIYSYARKLERNPIMVETFETIGLVYRNDPKIKISPRKVSFRLN